ncbi:deacylase [Halobacteriales archaeon QS_3_64_16]|nr:MAG: deacylase [Halobacteriales archaeon QS_3_64_16]
MQVGTARADPGERSRGWLEVADLPTGGTERLPVTIVRGERESPTIWVTASIHGDEVTPLAVAQDLLRSLSPGALRGTLVCLPVLNPAGLRTTSRRSPYHHDDPNRYFPALDREATPESESRSQPPRTQELIDRQVYDAIADAADSTDALLDLHTAGIGSLPYTIRDQVLFGTERDQGAAEDLDSALDTLTEALGLPVVSEFPVPEYFERNFHRTLSGSALNTLGVPAVTVELGGHTIIDEAIRERALGGLARVLAAVDVLETIPEELETTGSAGTPGAPVSYPVKRHDGPRVSSAGIIRHRVSAGDAIEAGDPIAAVLTPHGERREVVESASDGYVLARKPGVTVHANDAICSLAVASESDRVVPRNG